MSQPVDLTLAESSGTSQKGQPPEGALIRITMNKVTLPSLRSARHCRAVGNTNDER